MNIPTKSAWQRLYKYFVYEYPDDPLSDLVVDKGHTVMYDNFPVSSVREGIMTYSNEQQNWTLPVDEIDPEKIVVLKQLLNW